MKPLLVLIGLLCAGCATATYEQQARCAQVGGVPNMFNPDLCVQTVPGSGLGQALQNSTDYATGGANRGATGGFCYGCQGGYGPPAAQPMPMPMPNLDNSGRYVPSTPRNGN